MKNFHSLVKHRTAFLRCESGTTAIEYALIATLVVVVIIAAVTSVGGGVKALFVTVANAFS